MFRKFTRTFLPNPLDRRLRRLAKKGGKKVLVYWNRGLGDIALGLYAMVQRIREHIPEAEVTFLTREGLLDGFSLLEGVRAIGVKGWRRGEKLPEPGINLREYDLVLEKPDPTEWVRWQRGKVVPRLKWHSEHEELWEKFGLEGDDTYVGVQVVAETQYGLWRNWPLSHWKELIERLGALGGYKVLLFGFGCEPRLDKSEHVIDLRGKTTLFELLSIIKNRCRALILPDSGVLSMAYYLDVSFPLQVISLWADPNHGILKQAVSSPNPQLKHIPLIGKERDLSHVSAAQVLNHLVPCRPLVSCLSHFDVALKQSVKMGAIILAGGQGTRLGFSQPKGFFPIHDRSLFEWICEKAPKEGFPIAIMTSPLNHDATVAFFKERQFFSREIHFFTQPLSVSQTPDGNGSLFRSFAKSGLLELFAAKGVEAVTVVPVDNALADPADKVLVSHLIESHSDVVLKCVERIRVDEPMGALVERNGRLEVIEYYELNPQESYFYNNTGLMAIRLPFLQTAAQIDLPLHWVQKKVNNQWIWKGEKLIFDVLPYAHRVSALCYSREMCYAPLKSLDQLEQVKTLLERRLS